EGPSSNTSVAKLQGLPLDLSRLGDGDTIIGVEVDGQVHLRAVEFPSTASQILFEPGTTGLPDNLQDAVTALAESTPSEGATTSLIFRPGGVAGGNVYTDEEALIAALPEEGLVDILIDTSMAPAHPQFGVPYATFAHEWECEHR